MSGGRSNEAKSTSTSIPFEIIVATGVSKEETVHISSNSAAVYSFNFDVDFFFSINLELSMRFEAFANVELVGADVDGGPL